MPLLTPFSLVSFPPTLQVHSNVCRVLRKRLKLYLRRFRLTKEIQDDTSEKLL
jgi:hypothetical protein